MLTGYPSTPTSFGRASLAVGGVLQPWVLMLGGHRLLLLQYCSSAYEQTFNSPKREVTGSAKRRDACTDWQQVDAVGRPRNILGLVAVGKKVKGRCSKNRDDDHLGEDKGGDTKAEL